MNQYPVLSKGDRGSYVELLQKRLNDWGCDAGAVDGVFGDRTFAAVKDFQSKRQGEVQFARGPLVVDGVVGLETWAELTKTPVDEISIVKYTQLITQSQVAFICGRSPSANQLDDLNRCLNTFSINTLPRMRHFMAQIAHESGGLKWTKELASGWAYEMRFDLGNRYPGDGPKYKGAGFLQLTGRSNYASLASFMGDPKILEIGCDYVAERYAASSGGLWWRNNNMNAVCDRGASVLEVSQRVNGGPRFKGTPNGLSDRVYYYNRACEAIK